MSSALPTIRAAERERCSEWKIVVHFVVELFFLGNLRLLANFPRRRFTFAGFIGQFHFQIFPHLIPMQPNRICVSQNKLINIHAINGRLPPDSFLFAADKNGHVFFAPSLFLCLLRCSKSLFLFAHKLSARMANHRSK